MLKDAGMGGGMNSYPGVVQGGKESTGSPQLEKEQRDLALLERRRQKQLKVGRKVSWSTFRFPHDIQFELVMGMWYLS